MIDDSQPIEPNPSEPFEGLCKFLAWWTDFQQRHSQALFKMQIGLLKLQHAPNTKTNESES